MERQKARNATSDMADIHGFPVTTGSWFGESEILRESVLGGDANNYRRTSTAEARTVVKVILIPKDALSKVLFDDPQILQDLLVAHHKRFHSGDLPLELRQAFRFDDEWESRVLGLIGGISRARAATEYPLDRRASYGGPSSPVRRADSMIFMGLSSRTT